MIKLIGKFVHDQIGAVATEYVIILAILGASISVVAVVLSGAIVIAIEGIATKISD